MSSVYTDDSGWSDADTSSDDEDSTSSTSVDVSEPDNAPDWMKKFSLSKISEGKVKIHPSKSTDKDEDFLPPTRSRRSGGRKRESDDASNRSEASSSILDTTQDSDWLEKFENAKDGQLPPDPPLPALSDTGEIEIFNDYDSSSHMSSGHLDSTENSAWLKKFEMAKNNGKRKETRDASTQTISSDRGTSRKQRKYRKSRSRTIDKEERRDRIRKNLAKIRRRERIRGNLGQLKAQREIDQKEISTQTMTTKQSKRAKKHEKAISNDIDRVEIPHVQHNNNEYPVSSKIRNQSENETDFGSEKKIENKWSSIQHMWNNMKSPMQTPSTFEQKQRASTFGNTYTTFNYKAIQGQQNSKGISHKMASIAEASPYSHPKDTIDVPSIKSKVNALQNAIETKKANDIPRGPTVPKHHTYSPYREINAIAAKVTQEKADRSANDTPRNQINDLKPPPTNAEIENTVPDNLFGMWGDTVKTKKPITGASAYSTKKVKEQANLVKQKIRNARKGAQNETKLETIDDAAALFHAAGSNSNTEEGYRHFEEEEDAAALFHSAGARKNTEEGYIYNLDFEENNDDAAALFHSAGMMNNKHDARANDSSSEASTNEDEKDDDEYRWAEETTSDDSNSTDDFSDVAFDSFDDSETNSSNGFESSNDELDEEPSLSIGDLMNEHPSGTISPKRTINTGIESSPVVQKEGKQSKTKSKIRKSGIKQKADKKPKTKKGGKKKRSKF